MKAARAVRQGFLFALCAGTMGPACLLVQPLEDAQPGATDSGGTASIVAGRTSRSGQDAGGDGSAGDTTASGGDTAAAGSTSSGGTTAMGGDSSSAGSDSGGTSTAGSDAGTGNSTAGGSTGRREGCDDPLLIDDMETPDHNGWVCETDGRDGGWYVFHDGTSTSNPDSTEATGDPFPVSPLDTPLADSSYAAHVSGSGFTDWGGAMGFTFLASGTAYDASAYSGIRFSARGSESIVVKVNTMDTRGDDVSPPGYCTPTVVDCNDHYATESISLSSAWTEYTVPFAALAQQGWGVPVPFFDRSQVTNVDFMFDPNQSFDIWVDDVFFVEAECNDGDAQCVDSDVAEVCESGSRATYSCATVCEDYGFEAGPCADGSSCECGPALDPYCLDGADAVCYCIEEADEPPCTADEYSGLYSACYQFIPDAAFVECFGEFYDYTTGIADCDSAVALCLE